jgi:hypothetical protein
VEDLGVAERLGVDPDAGEVGAQAGDAPAEGRVAAGDAAACRRSEPSRSHGTAEHPRCGEADEGGGQASRAVATPPAPVRLPAHGTVGGRTDTSGCDAAKSVNRRLPDRPPV